MMIALLLLALIVSAVAFGPSKVTPRQVVKIVF